MTCSDYRYYSNETCLRNPPAFVGHIGAGWMNAGKPIFQKPSIKPTDEECGEFKPKAPPEP